MIAALLPEPLADAATIVVLIVLCVTLVVQTVNAQDK